MFGIEKQVVASAYLRKSGHELAQASFWHSARQRAGKPIRFTAKAPHINEFYARDFLARFFLPDQLQDFCF